MLYTSRRSGGPISHYYFLHVIAAKNIKQAINLTVFILLQQKMLSAESFVDSEARFLHVDEIDDACLSTTMMDVIALVISVVFRGVAHAAASLQLLWTKKCLLSALLLGRLELMFGHLHLATRNPKVHHLRPRTPPCCPASPPMLVVDLVVTRRDRRSDGSTESYRCMTDRKGRCPAVVDYLLIIGCARSMAVVRYPVVLPADV